MNGWQTNILCSVVSRLQTWRNAVLQRFCVHRCAGSVLLVSSQVWGVEQHRLVARSRLLLQWNVFPWSNAGQLRSLGLYFSCYPQVSMLSVLLTLAVDQWQPLTRWHCFSVCNTVKRAMLIWLSVLCFGNQVTLLSGLGTITVTFGVFLYNKARAMDAQRLETLSPPLQNVYAKPHQDGDLPNYL